MIFRILEKINSLLTRLFYKLRYGKKLRISKLAKFRGKFYLFKEKNGRINIGNVFFNRNCSINIHSSIDIGDNTIFGENVKIYDHNHVHDDLNVPISKQGFISKGVVIGCNCWIGSNVVILKGVNIGDNCIIGANCLIYHDIPENSIVKCKSELIIQKR